MDPNETLARLRHCAAQYSALMDIDDSVRTSGQNHEMQDAADDMVAYVQALDEWLAKGGFPPDAWSRKRGA